MSRSLSLFPRRAPEREESAALSSRPNRARRAIPWLGMAVATMLTSLALSLWASTHAGQAVARSVVRPEDYQRGTVADSFIVRGERTLCRLEYEAPVENSWVYLDVRVLDRQGDVVAVLHPGLSYYHGVADGRPWVTGATHGAELVALRPGVYRLAVSGKAGGGDSSAADFATYGRPVTLTVRAGVEAFRYALVVFAVSCVLSTALLLQALSRRAEVGGAPSRVEAPSHRPIAERKERFLLVDGLRGIAALGVVLCHLLVPELSHFATVLRSGLPAPLSFVLSHGDLGVEIFFVLSGFVIAYSIRGQHVTPAFATRFAARRAVRLDPPYYLALVLSMVVWASLMPFGMVQVFEGLGRLAGVTANACYLQDILKYKSPLSIAWTLCLEVQFYLAFIALEGLSQAAGSLGRGWAAPAQAAALRRANRARACLFLPLLAASLGTWYWQPGRFDFLGTWFRFFLGVLLCRVVIGQSSRKVFFGLVVLVTVLSAWRHDTRGFAALATALLIYVAARLGTLASWLSVRWIQFLGRISYSLYLTHLPLGITAANVLWAWGGPSRLAALGCAATAVLFSVAAAALFYSSVERQSIALSKSLSPASRAWSSSPPSGMKCRVKFLASRLWTYSRLSSQAGQ